MSAQLIDEKKPQTESIVEEAIPLPPTDLPYDDGEPLESNRHRIAMNVLIDSVYQAYQERDDYYSGGNMFVYYSSAQVKNNDFRGPDFFVVLDVDGTKERRSWIVWEEKGRYPDVIVELMSPSTARIDRTEKHKLYEQTFRTSEYFIYDPFDSSSLQGWRLGTNRKYQELVPNDRGWLWCESLGLWLGAEEGELVKHNAPWLRFYSASGNLILLPEELARMERERAEKAESECDLERKRAEQAETALEAQNQTIAELRARLQQLEADRDRNQD